MSGYEGNDPETSMKAGTTYGQKIDKIYQGIVTLDVSQETIEKYFNKDVVVKLHENEKELVVDTAGDKSSDKNEVKIDKEKVNIVLNLLEKVFKFFIKLFDIDKE